MGYTSRDSCWKSCRSAWSVVALAGVQRSGTVIVPETPVLHPPDTSMFRESDSRGDRGWAASGKCRRGGALQFCTRKYLPVAPHVA